MRIHARLCEKSATRRRIHRINPGFKKTVDSGPVLAQPDAHLDAMLVKNPPKSFALLLPGCLLTLFAGFMRISKPAGGCRKQIAALEEKEEEGEEGTGYPGLGKRRARAKKSQTKKAKAVDCEPNPLDQTWIHPESYEITQR